MSSLSTFYDVVVTGGTPGGIAAALAAARLGRSVLLVEYHSHFGGMSSSGLGKSDVEKRHLIGGLFQEFTKCVQNHYLKLYGAESKELALCQDGYYFEPSVAESVFGEMLLEQKEITTLPFHRLGNTQVDSNRLQAVELIDRATNAAVWIEGGVFIDATYEGDLMAAAGAEFRCGRESRDEFGEPHAGQIYYDYQENRILPQSTGRGDDRLPAYTYRLCLTTDPANSCRLTKPPEGYDRSNYLGYFEDLQAGRLSGPKAWKPGRGYHPDHFDTLVRALSITDLPSQKVDANINPRPLGFPFAEENQGYLDGDDSTRQTICGRIRNLTLGLLYFLQLDPEVPESHRALANRYHLPLDEFQDNGHFPFQLYVREGRRLVGEYTLTEQDITGPSHSILRHQDTIAIGEFPIDSFPCRKRQPGDDLVLEGYLGMLDAITRPYEIPYRIMIPRTLDGLIVPVAASTTHVAFSSIRMEPTWMALGQAAGTAAHLVLKSQQPPRAISHSLLQEHLAQSGQVLSHSNL